MSDIFQVLFKVEITFNLVDDEILNIFSHLVLFVM